MGYAVGGEKVGGCAIGSEKLGGFAIGAENSLSETWVDTGHADPRQRVHAFYRGMGWSESSDSVVTDRRGHMVPH